MTYWPCGERVCEVKTSGHKDLMGDRNWKCQYHIRIHNNAAFMSLLAAYKVIRQLTAVAPLLTLMNQVSLLNRNH